MSCWSGGPALQYSCSWCAKQSAVCGAMPQVWQGSMFVAGHHTVKYSMSSSSSVAGTRAVTLSSKLHICPQRAAFLVRTQLSLWLPTQIAWCVGVRELCSAEASSWCTSRTCCWPPHTSAVECIIVTWLRGGCRGVAVALQARKGVSRQTRQEKHVLTLRHFCSSYSLDTYRRTYMHRYLLVRGWPQQH